MSIDTATYTNTLRKPYKKLGFTYLETAEIVVNLKQVLSDYQVHYHKLRNYHWNVEGGDFFELHQEFENDYNSTKKIIDEIAERIRVFGQNPALTLEEILKNTKIKESKGLETSRDLVKNILKDYSIIHESILTAIESAVATGDSATELMLSEYIRDLEKRNWMYTSWLK